MIGSILKGSKGEYVVSKKIGEGGVGTVYKALEIATRNPLAVKVSHSKRFPSSDVQRRRFQQEIAACLAIQSSYIVKGIDSGLYDSEPFLVMEWMDGGTLQETIGGTQALSEAQIVSLSAQLLKSFRDLRVANLVHRDIKPNNVLLDGQGRLKLSDLGVAKDPSAEIHLTQTEAHIGSVLYISERVRQRPSAATHRDDFFAICLVLYELTTRRRVHTRNPSVTYLRPSNVPSPLARLIDLGMEDREDWDSIFQEMGRYIDLESEQLSATYLGSRLIPSIIIAKEHQRIIECLDAVPLSPPEPEIPSPYEVLRGQVGDAFADGFEECSREFADSGVSMGISRVFIHDTMEFGPDFDESIRSRLQQLDLEEIVYERLYGWACFEEKDGSVQYEGATGRHFGVVDDYLPERSDRTISQMNEDTRLFLHQLGRAVALGAALGALQLIEERLNEMLEREESPAEETNEEGEQVLDPEVAVQPEAIAEPESTEGEAGVGSVAAGDEAAGASTTTVKSFDANERG